MNKILLEYRVASFDFLLLPKTGTVNVVVSSHILRAMKMIRINNKYVYEYLMSAFD